MTNRLKEIREILKDDLHMCGECANASSDEDTEYLLTIIDALAEGLRFYEKLGFATIQGKHMPKTYAFLGERARELLKTYGLEEK